MVFFMFPHMAPVKGDAALHWSSLKIIVYSIKEDILATVWRAHSPTSTFTISTFPAWF